MSAADPAIVLGDLLGQQELALKLLSGGEDALRRPIAGAHAVELESPTRFLAKDWILLSAGPRLRGHRQAQRELVAELDEAGATALGFGIEPVFDQVPRTLLAEARARSFPVFAVPPKTPFRDVVSAVNRCLLSDELVNYQRLTSMQQYLMDALSEDEPERAVISRLAKLVDARILVFDPGGRLRMATAAAPEHELWSRVDASEEVVQEFDADGWHTVAMPIVTHAGQRPSWLVVTSRRKRIRQPAHAPGRAGDGAVAGGDGPAGRRRARPGARHQGLVAGGRPEGQGGDAGGGAIAGRTRGHVRSHLRATWTDSARARAGAAPRPRRLQR